MLARAPRPEAGAKYGRGSGVGFWACSGHYSSCPAYYEEGGFGREAVQ
jgi:hypothetical protein